MRTSVDLPDALLQEMKAAARRRGTTLRQLLLEGARTVLGQQPLQTPRPRLRHTTQDVGEPLVRDWSEIRRIIYEGRGE